MSSLDNLKKAARRWLKALRASNPDARTRLLRVMPDAPDTPGLRDVQQALARERGHVDWLSLRRAVDQGHSRVDLEKIEQLARDFLLAYQAGDAGALNRLRARTQHVVAPASFSVVARSSTSEKLAGAVTINAQILDRGGVIVKLAPIIEKITVRCGAS